jgi:hypothetical protein
LDNKVEVSEVRIGVDSAFLPPEGGQRVLSFTEIAILARPS